LNPIARLLILPYWLDIGISLLQGRRHAVRGYGLSAHSICQLGNRIQTNPLFPASLTVRALDYQYIAIIVNDFPQITYIRFISQVSPALALIRGIRPAGADSIGLPDVKAL
jgi:hypothetical protein